MVISILIISCKTLLYKSSGASKVTITSPVAGSTFETGWFFPSVTDARIYDSPSTQSHCAYLSFEFETCAICTDPKRNTNKYFSCITWSFIINEHRVQSLVKELSPQTPSKNFFDAVKKFPGKKYEK